MRPAARPDVLYLAHRVPFPPDKGDRIRTYQILRWLSQRASVYLACLADEPVDHSVAQALSAVAERVAIVPVGRWARWCGALRSLVQGGTATEGAFASRGLTAVLEAWGRERRFQVVLASASSMVPYLRRRSLQMTPAVIDLMDVDSQKWLDYAALSRWPRSWLYCLEGLRLRRVEQALPSWAHGIILTSAAEVTIYRGIAGDGPIHAVNNGVDLDYFRPAPLAYERRCAFVGALDYRPNVDAACWFCREVWPLVVGQRPDAQVVLVGRRPTAAVNDLAKIPGVEVVGQVPDVRPYLGRATVAIVPLRLARGVQNKVLEALAMARATVASPAALCGVRAQPGEHLLAASTPAEWAEAILKLFDSPDLRSRLGSAGRRFVEQHHRWECCLEPLADLVGLPRAEHEGAASVRGSQQRTIQKAGQL